MQASTGMSSPCRHVGKGMGSIAVEAVQKNDRPQLRAAVLHLVHGLGYFALAGKTNVLGVLLAE